MDKKKLVQVVLSAAVTGLIESLKDRYRTKQIGTRLAALDTRLADLDAKVDKLIPAGTEDNRALLIDGERIFEVTVGDEVLDAEGVDTIPTYTGTGDYVIVSKDEWALCSKDGAKVRAFGDWS